MQSSSSGARRARCPWTAYDIPWQSLEAPPYRNLSSASSSAAQCAGELPSGARHPTPGARSDEVAALWRHPASPALVIHTTAMAPWRPFTRTADERTQGAPLAKVGRGDGSPDGGAPLGGAAPEGPGPLPVPTLARRLTSALLGGRRRAVEKLLRGLPLALEQWRTDASLPGVLSEGQELRQGGRGAHNMGAEGWRGEGGSEAHGDLRLLKLLNAMLNGCAMAGNAEVGANCPSAHRDETCCSAPPQAMQGDVCFCPPGAQQGHWPGPRVGPPHRCHGPLRGSTPRIGLMGPCSVSPMCLLGASGSHGSAVCDEPSGRGSRQHHGPELRAGAL